MEVENYMDYMKNKHFPNLKKVKNTSLNNRQVLLNDLYNDLLDDIKAMFKTMNLRRQKILQGMQIEDHEFIANEKIYTLEDPLFRLLNGTTDFTADDYEMIQADDILRKAWEVVRDINYKELRDEGHITLYIDGNIVEIIFNPSPNEQNPESFKLLLNGESIISRRY